MLGKDTSDSRFLPSKKHDQTNVRFGSLADINRTLRMSAFGGKADIFLANAVHFFRLPGPVGGSLLPCSLSRPIVRGLLSVALGRGALISVKGRRVEVGVFSELSGN